MARIVSAPNILPETAAFWQAANEGRLLIKHCLSCGLAHYYPRDICPHCLSADTEWRESLGLGTVYSYSAMGQGDEAYTIAFVTLQEGITLMTNLIANPAKPLHFDQPIAPLIGAPVKVCFQAASNGQKVPVFVLMDN